MLKHHLLCPEPDDRLHRSLLGRPRARLAEPRPGKSRRYQDAARRRRVRLRGRRLYQESPVYLLTSLNARSRSTSDTAFSCRTDCSVQPRHKELALRQAPSGKIHPRRAASRRPECHRAAAWQTRIPQSFGSLDASTFTLAPPFAFATRQPAAWPQPCRCLSRRRARYPP